MRLKKIPYKFATVLALKNSKEPLLAKEVYNFIIVHMPKICTVNNDNWENAVRTSLTTCDWFEKLKFPASGGRPFVFYRFREEFQEDFETTFPVTFFEPYDYLENPEVHSKLYYGKMGFPTEREIEAARICFVREREQLAAEIKSTERPIKTRYKKARSSRGLTRLPKAEAQLSPQVPGWQNAEGPQTIAAINNTWNGSAGEFYEEILIEGDRENRPPVVTKYYEDVGVIEEAGIQPSTFGLVYDGNVAGAVRTPVHTTPHRPRPYGQQPSKLRLQTPKGDASEPSSVYCELKPLTERNVHNPSASFPPFSFYEQQFPGFRSYDQPPHRAPQQPAPLNFTLDQFPPGFVPAPQFPGYNLNPFVQDNGQWYCNL